MELQDLEITLYRREAPFGFGIRVDNYDGYPYIGSVKPESPADQSGLMELDTIISVNGTTVRNMHPPVIFEMLKSTDEAKVVIRRRNTLMDSPPPYELVVQSTPEDYIYTLPEPDRVHINPRVRLLPREPEGEIPGKWLFILSIISSVICFCPLGIAATVKTVEARTLVKCQKYEESMIAAKQAKLLLMLSIIVAAICWLIVLVTCLLSFLS